jgi:hypothetical protein
MLALGGRDGVIRVLSPSGRVLSRCALPTRERLLRIAWSPWKRHLASSHENGVVAVWDAQTEVSVMVRRMGGRVDAMGFSDSGSWIAVAGECAVRVFDKKGSEVRQMRLAPLDDQAAVPSAWSTVNGLCFAAADRYLAVAANDGAVRRYDAAGRLTGMWRHPRPVLSIASSAASLVTGCADGRVSLWSFDCQMRHRWQNGSPAELLARSAGGELVAVGSGDRMLRVWREDGTPVCSVELPTRPAGVGFLADGGVVTVLEDGGVDVWAVP